ncbi:MAG: polysaccharide biosynthesis C-terminal domain-containing protein [Saprospiraceae bacterium]|nr:polysaccharide biosynthesis C-terminal domain-containing protein [Saprospiraceae bacterium]
MNREFVINLVFLVAINLMVKPFFIFGIDLSVQNRVAADEYGRYFALLFVAYLFQVLCDFGLQNFNNRHISQHPKLLPKYFPNLFVIKLALSALYFTVTPLIAVLVMGYSWADMPLLGVLLLNQALAQMTLFLRSNMSGLGHYRLDSFLSSLDKLLMLITCGGLLWASSSGVSVMAFAWMQTLAWVITTTVVFVLLRRKATFSIWPSWFSGTWRTGWLQIRALLRKSLPYALVILLMSAYTRLDAILLERILPDGAAHAEVFAGAYRLLDAANMFGYLFSALLLPMFSRQLKDDATGAAVRPLLSLSVQLIWVCSVGLSVFVYFARYDLMTWMMHAEKHSTYRADVIGWLMLTFVPVCLMYIFGALLTARERLATLNRFFVVGIALELLLNLTLVPQWKAFGATLATLGTQTFIALAMIWLTMREFRFKPGTNTLIRMAAFVGWVVAANYIVISLLDWNFIVKTATIGAITVLGGVLLKLLRPSAIRNEKTASQI